MGLDDFASDHWLSEAAANEPANELDGEDLFDFPRVEMTVEGNELPAPLPALPSRQPAAAAAPAPAVQRETPRAVRPVPPGRPVRKSKPKRQAQPATQLDAAVPEPEELAADAPPLADDTGNIEPAPRERKRFQPRLFASATSALWIVIALLFGLNATALVVTWSGGRTFHAGLEELRNELAVAVHASRVDAAQQQAQHGQPTPAGFEADAESAEPAAARRTQAAPLAPLAQGRPLVPGEETALAVATREIEAREFASARRRLWRLLAVLDRVDAQHRGDVEARASFLLAESWLQQARVARETAP